MYTYYEQIEIIKDILLSENQFKRIDCPFCNGKNTFTISNQSGDTLWNCYKASCSARGIKRETGSNESIRYRINNRIPNVKTDKVLVPIPDILSNPKFHPAVMEWLEKNNCNNANVNIQFSPLEKRILFFYPNDKGAIGRTLIPNLKPKWKKYGDCSELFISTSKVNYEELETKTIVVEDVVSAIAASQLPNVIGIALGGTNLSAIQKHLLINYKNIKIALDRDASVKAISIADTLKPFTNVKVKLLEKDLKDLTKKEIHELTLAW